MGAMAVIDSDTHLYESRTLWSDYADPGDRESVCVSTTTTWATHG